MGVDLLDDEFNRACNAGSGIVLLDGSAHTQYLSQKNQRARVMREMLKFLAKPASR